MSAVTQVCALTLTLLLLVSNVSSLRWRGALQRCSLSCPALRIRSVGCIESKPVAIAPSMPPFYTNPNLPDWKSKESLVSLRRIRDFGSNMLNRARHPHMKDEAWRFTNVKKLFGNINYDSEIATSPDEKQLHKHISPQSRNGCIILKDGEYCRDWSKLDLPDDGHLKIEMLSASSHVGSNVWSHIEAVPDLDALARNSYGSDVLTSLNLVNMQELIHIRVQKPINDSNSSSPSVQIIFCSSGAKASFPRVVVEVESGANLHLTETYIDTSTANQTSNNETSRVIDKEHESFVCSHTQAIVATNATLRHVITQDMCHSARHCQVVNAHLSQNSNYSCHIVQLGAAQSRLNVHVNLSEPLANCTLDGLMIADYNQVLDLHSKISHGAPSVRSEQNQRVLLADSSRGVFKGFITIPSIGQKTVANQQCRTVILGERARAQVMPTLEIAADDVVCTHGATVGDIDQTAIFFMTSRGISHTTAKHILTRNFALSVLKEARLSPHISGRILHKLEHVRPEERNTVIESTSR